MSLLAGPGAGKTRTFTHRAAYLLESGRAQPWQILAVTFSVRAAGELRLRLADLLGERVARAVTAATFHSVCARLLREHASVFGRTECYTIYDQADMRHVIDWLLSDAERVEVQRALADYGQPASTEVLAETRALRSAVSSPESYERAGPDGQVRVMAFTNEHQEAALDRASRRRASTPAPRRPECSCSRAHRCGTQPVQARAGARGDPPPRARLAGPVRAQPRSATRSPT